MARLIPTPSQKLAVRPRQAQLDDGRFVEPIAHPLFSTAYLPGGALPAELVFFTTGVGDQLLNANAGVVCKRYHTNLEKGGLLPAPKCFIAQGIRLMVNPLAWAATGVPTWSTSTTTNTTGTPADTIDDLSDLVNILAGAVLTCEHQDQLFIEEPAWLCPSNYYLEGPAQVSVQQSYGATLYTGATANTETQMYAGSFSTKGIARSFGRFGRVINSQEAFIARLEWKMKRSAAGANLSGLIDGKLVTAILDGALVRAVR